jgi:hypothetical protein
MIRRGNGDRPGKLIRLGEAAAAAAETAAAESAETAAAQACR